MKKIYAIITAALLLCSCSLNENAVTEISVNENTLSESKTTAEESTTSASASEDISTNVTIMEDEISFIPDVRSHDFLTDEELLLNIIDFLQGDRTSEYLYWSAENYGFMDDFTIESYTYTPLNSDGEFQVKIVCSDSTFDMLPNGESVWYFGNGVFCPWNKAQQISRQYAYIENEPLKTAYHAANDFTLHTGVYEADEEWFENYTNITEVDVHRFYHAYNPYVKFSENIDGKSVFYDVTPEEFAVAVKKLYNINITAEQAAYMADEDGFMKKDCAHGGNWLYSFMVGHEENDSEIKITLDYYGDELYFYPVIEVEYTFAKNSDGTITLQGAEKIFDRGYEPASGSI